jgi:hypothetical protein
MAGLNQARTFFFEKKNQKTFAPETVAVSTPVARRSESFLDDGAALAAQSESGR